MTLINPRHEQFAVLVAGGMNASEAYKKAGFSAKGASQSASRLAKVPAVAARISALRKSLSAEALRQSLVSREWVLNGLKVLAETAGSEAARIRAYELCGREVGMFRDASHDSFDWDGDLSKLTNAQLANMLASLDRVIVAGEQAQLVPPVDIKGEVVL